MADPLELGRRVLERPESFLLSTLAEQSGLLRDRVQGARVLVVGGAGSIGSWTIRSLAPLDPAELHVVDQDENRLAELVRDLRSSGLLSTATQLKITPGDAGGPVMRRLLGDVAPFDLVLNFAAVKHVRSERDVYSLLRMLDVNVRLPHRLLEWTDSDEGRYFAVSTDKAAAPASLMGASKRLMEHVLMTHATSRSVTTARFANVAFSQGSLPEAWLLRLAKRQALAAPADTTRWFVTLEESGHLCLLAAVLGTDRRVTIPVLEPATALHDMVELAVRTLSALGLAPAMCDDEAAARALAEAPPPGRWPLLVTPRDTAGEKHTEIFIAPHDVVSQGCSAALNELAPPGARRNSVLELLAELDRVIDQPHQKVTVEGIVELIGGLVPELQHERSERSLDHRM